LRHARVTSSRRRWGSDDRSTALRLRLSRGSLALRLFSGAPGLRVCGRSATRERARCEAGRRT
jgi:hypothetical protein